MKYASLRMPIYAVSYEKFQLLRFKSKYRNLPYKGSWYEEGRSPSHSESKARGISGFKHEILR